MFCRLFLLFSNRATLVSELLEAGEKILRDKLGLQNINPSKLNDSICAQLCDGGLEALERATRFCSEKSPEAIRILLPEETSPSVLVTAENITKHLAAEKACSWLSANITGVIKREWKNRYDGVMKALGGPADVADGGSEGVEPVVLPQSSPPRKKQGGERAMSCPPRCDHSAPLPSDVLVEIKELLSIAVGPRTNEELPTGSQIRTLLRRVEDTLACRKFLTGMSEQMLLNSTVLLACKLVSGELPAHRCTGAAVGTASGSETPVAELLEQLAELWQRDHAFSTPVHQLFSPVTVSAVLKASDTEKTSYLFLVRRLVDKGISKEATVISLWKKLADLALPAELIESFQLQPQSMRLLLPLGETQTHMDALQASHQTVEGAT